jgi:hypothetical protein
MKANVGGIDKKLRMAAGAIILALGAYYQNWWGLVGLIPLGTALMNFCPAYPILGISTCKADKSAQ